MLEACYVLQRRPYRDTSLLLDVFSYQYGKVGLIAKGAYKAKSVRSAQLQPFQPLLLEWVGRSELKTVTKVEVPTPALSLIGDAVYGGMYVNELLYRLLPNSEPNAGVFLSYVSTLSALAQGEELGLLLRSFELKLLADVGLLPDFESDWSGRAVDPVQRYYLSGDCSFVSLDSVGMQSVESFSGQLILELARIRRAYASDQFVAEPDLKDYDSGKKRLMRHLINHALGGAQLHSRKLMKTLVSAKSI